MRLWKASSAKPTATRKKLLVSPPRVAIAPPPICATAIEGRAIQPERMSLPETRPEDRREPRRQRDHRLDDGEKQEGAADQPPQPRPSAALGLRRGESAVAGRGRFIVRRPLRAKLGRSPGSALRQIGAPSRAEAALRAPSSPVTGFTVIGGPARAGPNGNAVRFALGGPMPRLPPQL